MAGRTRLVVPIGAAPSESKARPFGRPGMRRRRRRRTRVVRVVFGVVAGGGRWSGAHRGEAKGQSDGRRCRAENFRHNNLAVKCQLAARNAYGSPIFARICSILRFLSHQVVHVTHEVPLQQLNLCVLFGAHHHLPLQLD